MKNCFLKVLQAVTFLITISPFSSSAYAGPLSPIQTVDDLCTVYDEWSEPRNYRAIWTGSCVSGKGQGFGSLLIFNTANNTWEFYFEGQLDEGRLIGMGLYIWPDGIVGLGNFHDGKLSGESIQVIPTEENGPFFWEGSYKANKRVTEGEKVYSQRNEKAVFEDRTEAILSLLISPQCNVSIYRALMFEAAFSITSFSNGFPLQGEPQHYYKAFSCLTATDHTDRAQVWLDKISPQRDADARSYNTECDLPSRFSSLCRAASDANELTKAVNDGYGLALISRDPMRSNKRLSGTLRVSSKTRFPLQRVLNLALNGNSDAMMVLALSFSDKDWSEYWARKALKVGNLSALTFFDDQQQEFFDNLGFLNRNVRNTLRIVNDDLVAISVGSLLADDAISNDYDRHNAWCLMSKWGGDNRDRIISIELPSGVKDTDIDFAARNIPTLIDQASKFGSECATNRLLQIAQFTGISDQTKTLSWFLENVDSPSIYSYALSCIFGSPTISSRFCDVPALNEDDALDLVLRAISAQVELSRTIYDGSGFRLEERAQREALWRTHISLAYSRSDVKFLRDVYLAAARDLKDRKLFLTAASLHDPYLFPELSKRDFFSLFEAAAGYLFEDLERYPFAGEFPRTLRSLVGSYFYLYSETVNEAWSKECAKNAVRGNCFDGEILSQVSMAMQDKSNRDFLRLADQAANDFLHYSARHHGLCNRDPSKTFSNGGIEKLEHFSITFYLCQGQAKSISDAEVMQGLGDLLSAMQDLINGFTDDSVEFAKFLRSEPPTNPFDRAVDIAFVRYWDTVVKEEWNKIPATNMSVDHKFDCKRPEDKQRAINFNDHPWKKDFVFYEECLDLPEMFSIPSWNLLNSAKDLGSIYGYIMLSEVTLNDAYVDRNQLSYRSLLPLTTLFPAKQEDFEGATRNRSLKWLEAVRRIYDPG